MLPCRLDRRLEIFLVTLGGTVLSFFFQLGGCEIYALSLVIFIEIAGQLISLIRNKQFLFQDSELQGRHHLFQPHPYLSVALNKSVKQNFEKDNEYHSVQTTELGTRWTGADLKDTTKIRIACLGGSTTFCTGVDDEDSWPAILQKKLGDRYAVINYGVPAYKTTEGIIQLALYVSEIQPDIVIFYEGGNDLYNSYLEDNYPDYHHHAEELMPMALLGTPKYESGFEKFKRQSGFFYIAHNIEERIYKIPMPPRYDVPDKVVDSLFVRNLRSMLALSSSMNAREIVIGQVLNPVREIVDNPWGIRIKSDKILPFMHRMNEMGREVCATDNTCIYYDFQNDLIWKPEHFWDNMHFTKAGNELFAESVKTAILNHNQIAEKQ